jgi:hypothetical protein
MKKQASEAGNAQQQPPPEIDDSLVLRLYKVIIERYREEIEAHESKSVADLKELIKPRDEKVLEIRDSMLSTFRPYIFTEHFSEAAKMCFSYVSSFKTISPPVSFWLSFSEMGELLAGDEIDKSILLCSLIRSIGSENAKIFVTDAKSSYVVFESAGRYFIADHGKKELTLAKSFEECMAHMKGKPIYMFSDREYEDFGEQE